MASVQSLNEHLFGVKQRWVKAHLLLAVVVQVVPVVPPELLPPRGRLGLELSASCCARDPLLLFLVLPETQKNIDWILQQNNLRLAPSSTSHTRQPMILASLLKRGGGGGEIFKRRACPYHLTCFPLSRTSFVFGCLPSGASASGASNHLLDHCLGASGV